MKKHIRLLLILACLLSLGCARAESPVSDPVMATDSASPSGFWVTWDCVYFGSYPTREIVKAPLCAVEPYALTAGDAIEDPDLYSRLEGAEWTDCETELEGVRYCRMKAGDAVSWAEDRPQHYAWDGADSWHYFRYDPIKWRVIEVNDGVFTLMADRMLDCAPYHTVAEDVYWEGCTLRSFLNGYGGDANQAGISYADRPTDSFLGRAFSDEEKRAIVWGEVRNPANYYFGTDCGADTMDAVYIMDEEEVFSTDLATRHGFAPSDGIADPSRRFRPTLYAMARGAWYSPVEENAGNGFWQLRTMGYTPANVNYVCDYGYIFNRGTFVTCNDAGIVPVIRVDSRICAPEYAGTRCSDGTFQAVVHQDGLNLSEPTTVADEASPSGLVTTWRCVYFGAYPACEVVAQECRPVEDYALEAGDLLVDPRLCAELEQADWIDDETELEGVRYRRLKAPDGAEGRVQHYAWDGAEAWHYFRYEPIKWRVIELEEDTALLLADEEMDCAPFNLCSGDVTWQDCTLRSFLNGYDAPENAAGVSYSERPQDSFYGSAFSDAEKASIVSGVIQNPNNARYNTDCGEPTRDKVFVLSSEDVYASDAAARHGFYPGNGVDDPARRFDPTLYAMARGTWYSPVEKYRGNGFWFMRTNGYTPANVSYICDFGYIYPRGTDVTCDDSGILPAIRVELSTAKLEDAGTVTSLDPH